MEETIERKDQSVTLDVQGMTCMGCAGNVEAFLKKHGMSDVQVDLAGGEAHFKAPEGIDFEKITMGLSDIGYESKLADEAQGGEQAKEEWIPLYTKTLISWIFTLPLIAAMFLPFEFLHNHFVQLALCLPVYGIGFWHFGKSAFGALKSGTSNMDVLIFLGSTAAFAYSLYGAFTGQSDYIFFETSASIFTLVLTGNVLEHRALSQTNSSMTELMQLRPKTAHLVNLSKTGEEEVVDVQATKLEKNQIVLIKAGEKAPCDGVVMSGEAYADTSLLTGESEPITLDQGKPIKAGYVIDGGSLYIQVKQSGKADTVGQIIDLVKKARSQKPPIQRLSDRVSEIFVPTIISIAAAWFLVGYFALDLGTKEAFLRSVAILVISCPCAMGLAVPAAVSVGLGIGSKKGILFKSAEVIEKLKKLEWLLLDKTGTLTEGHPSVKEFEVKQEEVLPAIKSLMDKSSHPLAQAIVEHLGDTGFATVNRVKEHKGQGMEGQWKDQKLRMGSYTWIRYFTDVEEGYDNYILLDDQIIGRIRFEDQLKAGMEETIQHLQETGLQMAILSGDRQAKVEAMAKSLGIDDFQGGLLPEDKLEAIKNYTQQGTTAMVGDGINDAPALSAADIGISMGSGSDLAQQQAEVVLLGKESKLLSEALQIGRKTYQTIRGNLFWAFSYNLIAIPIAAAGLLDPMWAAGFMAFSDLIVIGNSLILKYRT